MNCLLEEKDVFAVMPTGSVTALFSCSPQRSNRKEDLRRRVSEECDCSYVPGDRPD